MASMSQYGCASLSLNWINYFGRKNFFILLLYNFVLLEELFDQSTSSGILMHVYIC